MFLEDAARKFLNLAERHGFKPASALKSKGKATNSAEKVENAKFGHSSASMNCAVSKSDLPRNASATSNLAVEWVASDML